MSTITATDTAPTTRARPSWRRLTAPARTALAQRVRQGAQVASAARHHNWSPALTVSGLATIDAALYQHGWFAGLLATGISILVFDWARDNG